VIERKGVAGARMRLRWLKSVEHVDGKEIRLDSEAFIGKQKQNISGS
jgi:hypothetical protein